MCGVRMNVNPCWVTQVGPEVRMKPSLWTVVVEPSTSGGVTGVVGSAGGLLEPNAQLAALPQPAGTFGGEAERRGEVRVRS